jgi:magnesium chelatase family protein
LLDRIDIQVEAPPVGISDLRSEQPGECSGDIRKRTEATRLIQQQRFAGTKATSNARMSHAQIRKYCAIDKPLGDMLQQALEQLHLSARAYDRIRKSPAPSPTWPAQSASSPPTSWKPSNTTAWIGIYSTEFAAHFSPSNLYPLFIYSGLRDSEI